MLFLHLDLLLEGYAYLLRENLIAPCAFYLGQPDNFLGDGDSLNVFGAGCEDQTEDRHQDISI